MKKIISQEEIAQCINLLHPDYHGCPVYVFYNFWDYVKWSFKHSHLDLIQLKKAWKGMSSGVYNSQEKFIQIYVFNHDVEDRYIKQCIIHTLYHELRHYYQFTYKARKWSNKMMVTYSLGDPKYSDSYIEKDANNFAGRMMEKNRMSISEVLNVFPEWEVLRG